MAQEHPVLELRGITKRFPGVVANDRVGFDLRRHPVELTVDRAKVDIDGKRLEPSRGACSDTNRRSSSDSWSQR